MPRASYERRMKCELRNAMRTTGPARVETHTKQTNVDYCCDNRPAKSSLASYQGRNRMNLPIDRANGVPVPEIL